jgi:hypothetical protein
MLCIAGHKGWDRTNRNGRRSGVRRSRWMRNLNIGGTRSTGRRTEHTDGRARPSNNW